jgi:hypothetical protein
MTGDPPAEPPDCPECRTPLDINGVDPGRAPAVLVYSCPRCRANYFQKVKLP